MLRTIQIRNWRTWQYQGKQQWRNVSWIVSFFIIRNENRFAKRPRRLPWCNVKCRSSVFKPLAEISKAAFHHRWRKSIFTKCLNITFLVTKIPLKNLFNNWTWCDVQLTQSSKKRGLAFEYENPHGRKMWHLFYRLEVKGSRFLVNTAKISFPGSTGESFWLEEADVLLVKYELSLIVYWLLWAILGKEHILDTLYITGNFSPGLHS